MPEAGLGVRRRSAHLQVCALTQCSTGFARNSSDAMPSPPTRSCARRPEGVRERSHAGAASRACARSSPRSPSSRAPRAHDEIHLAVALAPVEELARARRRGVGEVCADRRLDQATPELPVRPRLLEREFRLRRHQRRVQHLELRARSRAAARAARRTSAARPASPRPRAGPGSARASSCCPRPGAGRASSCTRGPAPSSGSRARTGAGGAPACPRASAAARRGRSWSRSASPRT